MNRTYLKIKEKARACRDRDVRIKLELFLLAIRLQNVSEACARRGFSRRFYYRWWSRFKRSGYNLRALEEYSRRPRTSPNQISSNLELAIRWYARRQYGARMIEGFLARDGIKVSRSTICHVLRRRRASRPLKKRARLRTHNKRYELVIPGQRMQLDVKYVPELVQGQRVYCYVLVDECTRWRFARGFLHLDQNSTVEFLEQAKKACPFPIHTIQTDNGFEFTYALNPTIPKTSQHAMDRWCQRHGIRHRLIPPGVKELNGKVERSHRIDEQYFYWRAPTQSIERFNKQLILWIEFYNSKRPHGGLGYLTPEEKLHERLETLEQPQNPPLSPELEVIRLMFIDQTPKRLTAEDRKLHELEQELSALLRQAA